MMAKTKSDEQDFLAVSGDFALKSWAGWNHDRGPDWSQTNILWRAAHGVGHCKVKEPEPPKDIEQIELAVVRQPPMIRAVLRCWYIHRGTKPQQHAKQLQITWDDFKYKLKLGQRGVAKSLLENE